MSLSNTTTQLQINTGEAITAGPSSNTLPWAHQVANTFSDGTGANKAQKVVAYQVTLNTTGVTLDLTAVGPGLNSTSNVNFTKIKGIIIQNTDGTNQVKYGNAASAQWLGLSDQTTGTGTLNPGATVAKIDPSAAGMPTSGANNFKLAAVAGTATVILTLIGEGA